MSPDLRRLGCGMMLALGPALMAGAQTPTGKVTAPRTSPDENPAVFRTGTTLVLVDVVVREKGKPVTGLKAADFQVLEDERAQPLTTFEEHKATDTVELRQPPQLPAHVYGDFPRYSTASAANVLLLDALNTPLQDQKFLRQRMLKFMSGIPAGTEIAVFTLGSRMRMVSGLTTDRDTIVQALDQERTPAQKSVLVHPEDDKAERDVTGAMQGGTLEGQAASVRRSIQDFEDDQQGVKVQQQAAITIAALTQLGRYLSTIPGRKNLIWFSRGFPIRFTANELREHQDYSKALRAMEALLARARVAVYPVDAGGLATFENASLANVTAPTEAGKLALDMGAAKDEAVRNDIAIPQQWANEHAAMKDVATATGGEAFIDTNDVGRAMQKAIADGSYYYTLGYAAHTADDGAWHAIRVRIVEGRYELAYRPGYFAADPNQPELPGSRISPMAAAMKPGVPPLSQVIFEARVLPAGDAALNNVQPTPGTAGKPAAPLKTPVTRFFIDYSIDPRGLMLKQMADGRRQAELEVTQALYDDAGKRVNITDAGLEVTLTAAQFARAMQIGMGVRQEIDVPAANVYLHLGVRDAATGRIGTIEVPVKQETEKKN